MSYGRCVACHEDGVKRPFGKVCIYCGTNQKQFRKQEQAEFRESYDAAAENAGKYKWISIPIGLGAAVLSFVLSSDAGAGGWSILIAIFCGVLGYVYSLHILAIAVVGLIIAVLAG